MTRIRIDSRLCDGCGICVSICPSSVLELRNGNVKVGDLQACVGVRAKQLCSECADTGERCVGCIVCVRNCPTAAIEIFEM